MPRRLTEARHKHAQVRDFKHGGFCFVISRKGGHAGAVLELVGKEAAVFFFAPAYRSYWQPSTVGEDVIVVPHGRHPWVFRKRRANVQHMASSPSMPLGLGVPNHPIAISVLYCLVMFRAEPKEPHTLVCALGSRVFDFRPTLVVRSLVPSRAGHYVHNLRIRGCGVRKGNYQQQKKKSACYFCTSIRVAL